MGRVHPALQLLLLGGAALSMFGWMGTDVMAMPRLLFAFARDGFLPAALGRLHPRSRAPRVAIMVHAGIGMVLALTGTFAELVSLSALASAALYILGCAAAWILRRRNFSTTGTPVVYRGLSIAAAIGIAGMALLIAVSQWHEILGLAVLIGASVALYAGSARRGR
jgi:amino acid transporter